MNPSRALPALPAAAAAAAAAVLALSACSSLPRATTTLEFDPGPARRIHEAGPNSVSGTASRTDRSGREVTCHGWNVRLIPAGPYAAQRMELIYGSAERGDHAVARIDGPDPEYVRLSRSVPCGEDGGFAFASLPDGEYHIATKVLWHIRFEGPGGGRLAMMGGPMMRKVRVSGGQDLQVRLGPGPAGD